MTLLPERLLNVARLLQAAFGAYALHITLIAVLGFFASLLEALGISAVIPIFSFVTGGSGAAADTITHIISGVFAYLHIPYTFRFLLLFVGTLFVVRTPALFAIQNVPARFVFGYERDMRKNMFRVTLMADWPFLSLQKAGHLDQLLLTNTTNTALFFGFFSTMVLIITKTIAYLVIAINISLPVARLSLLAGVLLFFVLKPLFRWNKVFSTEAEGLNRSVAHYVSQHLSGVKTVKALAVEGPVARTASRYFEGIRNVHVRITTLRGFLEMGAQFAGLAFVACVFAYMYRSGSFNFASFAIIVYAVNQIFAQVQSAQVQLHSLTSMIPYLQSAISHIRSARESGEREHGSIQFSFERDIEFRDVSFSYPKRTGTLDNISFRVPHGKIVAIVGPSGAGKSTIADLLLHLIEPSSGNILIDGRDLKEVSLHHWRKVVGYVPQEPFLLNDTIRNNIAFYDVISDDDMRKFAERANIHDFIETLPEKYDTHIGDRGVFLSGGQRQRIVLTRLLARKPKLLVLDEATSALDPESQTAIRKSIEKLRGEGTVIIIAHSGEMRDAADITITLEDGKVQNIEHRSPKGVVI